MEKVKTDLIVRPQYFRDFENVAEKLTDNEKNILVIMTDYAGEESLSKIQNFICSYSCSYAKIRIRNMKSKKMFVCYSEHV